MNKDVETGDYLKKKKEFLHFSLVDWSLVYPHISLIPTSKVSKQYLIHLQYRVSKKCLSFPLTGCSSSRVRERQDPRRHQSST